ncbi:MAG: 30S ribosome-binding factor RbfA [Myxococcota bacterium]
MSYSRASRVADNIFRQIGMIILTEVSDPRLEKVTITGVDISPDMKNAMVYFSLLDAKSEGEAAARMPEDPDEWANYVKRTDKTAVKNALKAFERAEGFIKKKLLERLELKRIPKLSFKYDVSYQRGHRIVEIIKKIQSDEGAGEE